jgi:hypothetical protein
MRFASVVLAVLISAMLAQAQTASPTSVASTGVGSTKAATAVFEKMDKQVDRLADEIKRENSKVQANTVDESTSVNTSAIFQLTTLLRQTDDNIEALKKIAKKRNIPVEYEASIEESTSQIEAIRRKDKITPHDVRLLEEINEDVRIKRMHAEARPNAPFESIKVTVHTKKNGQEMGVYQIWWVKYAYRDDPSKYKTFDKFSSPSSQPLPPGRYLMWTKATDGSQVTGEKTPKEFGDGSGEIDTDLIAP